MAMKKFLIFDLDGTLIDTAEGITKAVNNTLAHFEYPYNYEKSEIIKLLGRGARYLFAHATKKEEVDEDEFSYFTVEYVKTQNISKLYPNVKETLISLYQKGYQLMVFSNKPNGALQFLMKDKLSDIHFVAIQGNVPEYPPKPDPILLNKIMNSNGLNGGCGYYVGDSIVDLETARNANLKSIILRSGYGDYDEIEKAKPDYMIDDFSDLIPLLNEIEDKE